MRIAYWLWLLAMSVILWITTDGITHWILNQSYPSTHLLQADVYPTTQITQTFVVTAIDARIERLNNSTEVTLETIHPALARLEFKFLFTETTVLEAALARELNTTSATVRSLIRYHIE